GTGKRLPDVSDPVLSITDVQEFLVFVPVTVFCGFSFIAELPLFVQRFQPVQELSSEKFGNCPSRKKESPILLVPVAVSIKPSTSTEHMDMWMVGKVGGPCMHDADEARDPSQMCRIIGKFHDRFRGSMEKQGIQFLLIAIDQGIQFAGAGKYDVVVIN